MDADRAKFIADLLAQEWVGRGTKLLGNVTVDIAEQHGDQTIGEGHNSDGGKGGGDELWLSFEKSSLVDDIGQKPTAEQWSELEGDGNEDESNELDAMDAGIETKHPDGDGEKVFETGKGL